MLAYVLCAGLIAFLLFIASDFFTLYGKKRWCWFCLLTGAALLAGTTVFCVVASGLVQVFIAKPMLRISAAFAATAAFALLMYTLFFALPTKKTYVNKEAQPLQLVSAGMYALCRHPGVIWYALFYFFLWLATENVDLLWMGIVTTVLDVIYVVIQDRYIFPKTIEGYDRYKETTPFLVPNRESVLRATSRNTMFSKGENR